MNEGLKRLALVESLKVITPEKMDEMLGSREADHEALERPDFVWHFLLQSFATMGNSRGWDGLIGNRDNYGRVTFEALYALDRTERLNRLDEVLRAANVRMPGKKAVWLDHNYEMITEMGGPEEARRQALAHDGMEAKIAFMKRFHGIGPKYARNIWMDVRHPDFRDTIAVDERIKKVTQALRYTFKTYEEEERFYQEIAREVGISGWELDRLLYNYTDRFVSAISDSGVGDLAGSSMNAYSLDPHKKVVAVEENRT
jgi:hypothetical protein